MDQQNNQPGDMNKTYTYVAVAIIVLAIAAWGIYTYNHQNNAITDDNQAATQPSTNTIASSTPTSTPESANTSYGDAIKKYLNRFQFSKCQGTPAVIAVKKGSPVMIDNRDAVSHAFKVDTQVFSLAGYGFKIVYPQVIGNLAVTCDGKNRVTLNVQK